MKILLALLIPMLAYASPETQAPDWILTDISTQPELAAFFGDADALITVRKHIDDAPETIKPTVFLYKIDEKPANQLVTSEDWLTFLKPYTKNEKRVILSKDSSRPGRFLVEFTVRHKATQSDLHSLYLVLQNPDHSMVLLIYDGVGPAASRHIPHVRALFNELDQPLLSNMYRADLKRRRELKSTP